jgi:hypothetical protein
MHFNFCDIQVLTAANMKMIKPSGIQRRCSLVEELRVSIIIALMMQSARTSETSVYFNETTRRYMPEGSHLHTNLGT